MQLIQSRDNCHTYTTGGQYDAAVAADALGNFIVVWSTGGPVAPGQDGSASGIFARRFDSGGTPQGAEFQVNVYTTGRQITADVAALPDGKFMAVWRDQERKGVYARAYDAAGAPVTDELPVDNEGFTPAIAAGGTEFVVTWDAGPGMARRYDASGTPLSAPFRVFDVSTIGGVKLFPVPDEARGAVDAADNFLIVGGRTIARRYGDQAPIEGAKLTIKDHSDVSRRGIFFRSRDQVLTTTVGVSTDPVADGATLHVYNDAGGGDSACFELPAAGWTAGGNADTPIYRYRDKTGAFGPCQSALLIHRKVLKVKCRAKVQPISYDLDLTPQETVGVRFTSAGATYCATFGGTIKRDDDRAFRATKALAPGGNTSLCPTPPVACP